jgi:sigma-B regulation protein RsbU (phosphoserine phosphatase)
MSEAAASSRVDTWSDLLKLAAGGSGERPFLERLFRFLRESTPVESIALYLRGEHDFQLEICAGDDRFPECPPEAEERYASLELPGARLLYRATEGSEWSLPGDLAVVLATSVDVFRLRRQLKRRRFEVNYRGVELEALYDVGLAINSTLNLEDLHAEILLRAVSLLDARRGALYLIEDDSYRLEQTFGGQARGKLALGSPEVQHLLGAGDPGEVEVLAGAEHLLGMPIEVDGSPRGLLLVADKESRKGVGPFPPSDHRTLSLFATQAAIAIENARLHRQALEKERLEKELDLAAEIQRGLLPKVIPEVPGYELLGWSRPARHVGGDYYDLLPLEDGSLGLVVADVSGKGMPAALLVSTLHSALRLLLDRFGPGPELLERLNRHIYESSAANRFITLLLTRIEAGGDRMLYLNAGHNPALLVRTDGEVVELVSGGLPLGLMPERSYCSEEVESRPGDLLCAFSDGSTECASPDGEEFGDRRLAEILGAHADRPLAEIVAAVERATTDFAAGLPQGDDQTILLMRRSAAT